MDLLKLHLYAKSKKSGGITPSGTIAINENGDHDVTQYVSAAVNVPVGVFPEGDLNIVENGSYDVTQYVNVNVEVPTGGGEGEVDRLAARIEGSITNVEDSNVKKINQYAFCTCEKLVTADFPAATSIGAYAFNGCTNLTTVNFPAATSIGNSAFQSCTKLKTADFPSVTSLGSNVFNSCCSLTTLILRSETVCTLSNTSAFTECYRVLGTVNSNYNPNGDKDGYIYVPRALIDQYKAATNWSTYASQFRVLEDYTVDGTTTGALDESKI